MNRWGKLPIVARKEIFVSYYFLYCVINIIMHAPLGRQETKIKLYSSTVDRPIREYASRISAC